jgi:NCAIR mutase (PurE)-related protein
MPNDLTLDWERMARTGTAEAVFCDGKTDEQIAAILAEARRGGHSLLLTRLSEAQAAALPDDLDHCALSRTAILDAGLPDPQPGGIAVVCAGTSDARIAREAQRTLRFHGVDAPLFADVGVAGLWRLTNIRDELAQFRVVIAVAGMEGALFSVLAGMIPGLVIAVPSAVGYGVAQNGATALHAALASCAPGVVTVNIDNGFGAACAALKIARVARSDT